MKQLTLSEAMARRKPLPWTQEELEEKAAVSQSTISGILRGVNTNPSSRIVRRLEDALDLERGQLRVEAEEEQSKLPLKRKAS